MDPFKAREARALIVASGIAVASAVAAKRGVSRREGASFRTVNGLPDAFGPVLWAPMQMGALGAPLALAVGIAAKGDKRAGARVAVAGCVTWLAAKGLKKIVARQRPGTDIPETRLRYGSADHGLGYPSGHAAVATIVGAVVGDRMGRYRPIAAIGVPAVVGFSRMHVGAHYPLDVVGGWALGRVIVSLLRLSTSQREASDHPSIGQGSISR